MSRVSWLLVALSLSHCTLTSDPYAPNPLGDTQTDTGRLEGGEGSTPTNTPPGEPSEAPQAPPSTEQGPSPVALDPADPETDIGSGASSGSNGGDAAPDAGTDSADAGASVPSEPSEPPAEPEPSEPEPSEPEPTEPSEPAEPEPSEPEPSEPTEPVDTCPGSELGSSCYEFFAERLAWDAAEARCVSWGGHLASIESSAEDDFLDGWPALLGVPQGDGSGIWIGGTDARQDGDFRWSDGRALGFAGWAPNQPDNGAGVDCIEKRNDGEGRWFDLRCTDAAPYVCERPL